MKILLKKENIKILLSAIIYFVLGVLFCAFLGKMLDVAETTICFVFLVGGAVLLLAYGLLPADGKVYQILIYGIICLGLGLLILMVRMFFMIALAALIAYGGIQSIMTAVKLERRTHCWHCYCCACAHCCNFERNKHFEKHCCIVFGCDILD